MRWAGCLLLMTSIASGCAAKVSHEPDSGAGTSSTGSGGAGAGAADAAEAGVEWTHDPGKTFSYVGCKDHGMVLFVEICRRARRVRRSPSRCSTTCSSW
ncbi:hypothetical protein ACMHYB_38040 [Sorangium sp. So ce1128]